MGWKVILNPYAKRGKGAKKWIQAEKEMKKLGLDYKLEVTQYHGHAIEIAERAANDGYSQIVSAGGDGTLSEVINGIKKASGNDDVIKDALGVLPLGTSNDLAFALNIPNDPAGAVRTIARGQAKTIDLCKVNDRYFFLNAAIGFEGMICVNQNKIKFIQGPLRYTFAGALTILKNRKWNMNINWENGSFAGESMLVTVGNLSRTAGYYMSPGAKYDDGLLTFVNAAPQTRMGLLKILTMCKNPSEGNYIELDGINQHHARSLKIKLTEPSPMHVDGELISETIEELEFSVIPGGLKIIC